MQRSKHSSVMKRAMSGKTLANNREKPSKIAGQPIKRAMPAVGRTSEALSREAASKRGISSIESFNMKSTA